MTYGARQGYRDNLRQYPHEDSLKSVKVVDVLEGISYKPGWSLSWNFAWDSSHAQIRWHMLVPDAFDPDKLVEFESATVTIPLPTREETLVREAWRLALRAEEHEAGEFFKYRGQRVRDPHDSWLEEGRRFG